MRVLAIDTAGSGCTVALLHDNRVLAERLETMERGQDSRLVPLIQQLLTEADMSFPALDRIAAARGPGSFTGLRIGLATAQGLGAALKKPVFGFDRFDLFHTALRPAHKETLMVVIDSKRDELFARLYDKTGTQIETQQLPFPALMALAQQHKAAVAGDCLKPFITAGVHTLPLPASEAVLMARAAQKLTSADATHAALPLYIRPPDVSQGPQPPAETAA